MMVSVLVYLWHIQVHGDSGKEASGSTDGYGWSSGLPLPCGAREI